MEEIHNQRRRKEDMNKKKKRRKDNELGRKFSLLDVLYSFY